MPHASSTIHLVFLSLYYPPDDEAPGLMLEGVVERLVADGHRVTVLLCVAGGGDSETRVPGARVLPMY